MWRSRLRLLGMWALMPFAAVLMGLMMLGNVRIDGEE